MRKRMQIGILLCVILTAGRITSQAQESRPDPFLGMWALTLDYADNNAGWLKVTRQEGYLDSEILWRWGEVYPVDFTFVNGDQLLLVHGKVSYRDIVLTPIIK